MVKRIMWAAALTLIQKHGSNAAAWAAEQAQALRAAGDVKGGIVFDCLRDCVEHVQAQRRPAATLH
jgi:hypothetical protein